MEVLYKISSFRPDRFTNMAATSDSCFWLSNIQKSSKPHGKWTQTLQETSIGGPLHSFLISSYKHNGNGQFLFLIGWYFKNLLSIHMAKWDQTIQETSMGSPIQSFVISSGSDNKHWRHGQFLFLIGWYFKNPLWNHMAKWNQTWQEASMAGRLQNFLFLSWSDNRYDRHSQFLFLIGWYLKNLLKLHGQMEPNVAGIIHGRFFTKFPHFVFIWQQTWPPRAILVSDWLIFQILFLWNHKAK